MKKIIYIALLAVIAAANLTGQVCPGVPGQITYEVWQNLPDDEFSDLSALFTYPNRPDISLKRYRIQTPTNFDNYMGARLRGYISVPTTTTTTFNITGERLGQFYLSTDSDPANAILIAEHTSGTSVTEHDKYPEQTSMDITLQAGQYYYFELLHIDNGGSDHSAIYWKNDIVDPLNWTLVTYQYIADVDCLPDACPAAGTPCDDGNANTTDDIHDGNCNCVGSTPTANSCIGDRGKVAMYRYEGLPGGNLTGLYSAANYPAMPDYSAQLQELGYYRSNAVDSVGQLLQGYLTVPVTGDYRFNVTGDDNTVFFLSSDEDIANKTDLEITVTGWTHSTQHDKYEEQTSVSVALVAGEYYYYEVNNKEGGGHEFFTVFWEAPAAGTPSWKRIPSSYLYDYTCTLACIPAGTACDDGNPMTTADAYDDNCECVGVPCEAPNCDDPLGNYIPYDKCAITDQLDNRADAMWLSCELSASANSSRPPSHWIMYDLSERHFVMESHVWNYNVPGETQKGFTNVAVDYSMDRQSWTELGTYSWPEATGGSNYSGFSGPSFGGVEARYILITSLDQSEPCQGLGKVAFTAVKCPFAGTVCDDGDLTTYDDQYNDNCECTGTDYLENECEDINLVLGDSLLMSDKYSAVETVLSVSEVDATHKVSLVGGDYIELNPGFETQEEAVFLAAIDTCDTAGGRAGLPLASLILEQQLTEEQDKQHRLQVLQSDADDVVTIKYHLPSATRAILSIIDTDGKVIQKLTDRQHINSGVYAKRLRTKKLNTGAYIVRLESTDEVQEELLMVR